MKFIELANIYQKLENTSGKLEKTDIISEFLQAVPEYDIENVLRFLTGEIFSVWEELELGVGSSLIHKSIERSNNISIVEIKKMLVKSIDIGVVIEKIKEEQMKHISINSELTVLHLYETFKKIAMVSGEGSQDKKIRYISILTSNVTPVEAKFILRIFTGNLRIGVAEALVRNAISKAFNIDKKIIDRAIMYNNIGIVAKKSYEGIDEVKKIKMELFVPVKPMLAQISPNISTPLEEQGKIAFEIKYDGARVQIHKKGNEIKIYSRKLENVTEALPDIVRYVREAVIVENIIIDGEAVAINRETGRPKPFQEVLKRFRRKHNIEDMVRKIPFEVFIFDILYINGENITGMKYEERREILEKNIISLKRRFTLSGQIVTYDLDEAERFYNFSLDKGHEGVMIKNINAPYMLGSRGANWLKVKPIMETLDLVIIGATWGTGKRSGVFGSYKLGVSNGNEFMQIGNVGTGLSDIQLEKLTARLKPYIEKEEGQNVFLKPDVVVEIAYQDIQKSVNRESGYALRFPRVVNIREDKSINESDNIERVVTLFNLMNKGGS